MGALAGGFEEIAARYRGALLAYLTRMLRHEDDAQDACQETLLRAHRAFARLRPDSNVRAWLYRIATTRAIETLAARRRQRARTSEMDVDTLPARVSGDHDERERLRLLARAIETLPPKQRAALVQRRFEGLEYVEIGAALGCSPESARANVYQALRKLRAALATAEGRAHS